MKPEVIKIDEVDLSWWKRVEPYNKDCIGTAIKEIIIYLEQRGYKIQKEKSEPSK